MTNGVSCLVDSKGIATLLFDTPDEKVNTLSREMMAGIQGHLETLAATPDLKWIVLRSAKPGVFFAGADIRQLSEIQTLEESETVSALGQSIFTQLESMSVPTIALIQGVCVGGGLELALACNFRLATDHPKVQLGLPEVNLGIIPGWGGTQRLPRLIGLQNSFSFILTGKLVDAKKALKVGLVDRLLSDVFVDDQLSQFMHDVETIPSYNDLLPHRHIMSLITFFLEYNPLGRLLLFWMARRQILSQTKGHYPAPLAALKSMLRGFPKSLQKGLKIERRYFRPLPLTPVSKSLVSLFFAQDALKKDANPYAFKATGVLGAGLMGGGIAWTLSHSRFKVRLKDISWDAIGKGYEAAYKIYQGLVSRRKLTEAQAQQHFLMISGGLDYTGFLAMDIVIEAIVENMDLKKKVLKELEAHIRPDAIIASNTSSLSISEMGTALEHPERFVGMHFFSPVNRMPLVEVIAGEQTSQATIDATVSLAKQLKKTPIVVKNCPGFLVNRILIPYVNEAVYCLQEGWGVAEIDRLMVSFGMPIGPLALADEVGLDVGFKVAKILEEGYGDRMKVAPLFDGLHQDKTLLGKKTGRGFYLHTGKKKAVNTALLPVFKSYNQGHVGKKSAAVILDRLTLVMLNEAAKCLEEGVVQTSSDLDMAMIMGTGFPPFRQGLCAYGDALGIPEVLRRLTVLQGFYGDRFAPADLLVKMAKAETTFYTKERI